MVPDHWVPITLIARQRGWSMAETARAALMAGTGHVVSTLAIAAVVWIAGVAVAARFGQIVDTAASIALVGFGGWIAISAWRELRGGQAHSHGHGHSHSHDFTYLGGDGIHGPELLHIDSGHSELLLSIYEAGVPPRFRLTGTDADRIDVETVRPSGSRQTFQLENHGSYWESVDDIPEPHVFDVAITVEHRGREHRYETGFVEHEHGHDHSHEPQQYEHDDVSEATRDPLYAPLRADAATLTRHVHVHRHQRGPAHVHWHDHLPDTAHLIAAVVGEPPLHEHRHKMTARTALLVILGSSPMVEGIPAFFAAAKYGVGLIVTMSVVFALSTIMTYVGLCVYATAGLQRLKLGAVDQYGEVLSGAFIALVGMAFWMAGSVALIGHLQMRWRPLNLVEITALLFAITIGGLVWYGGSIAEMHRLNFGACGGRGSICIPAANESIPKNSYDRLQGLKSSGIVPHDRRAENET